MLFLMYEEIKKKPKIQLKRLAEFLEPISIEEENFGVVDEILKMCNAYNLFFHQGEIGDWKNYFTTQMSDKLNHTIEENFQGSQLKFSYD
uniref:Sulfotransferase n=1 Tax=Solanum lycopersicum TaxID=4081 RepID=K4D8Q8_SOLLC